MLVWKGKSSEKPVNERLPITADWLSSVVISFLLRLKLLRNERVAVKNLNGITF